MSRGSPYGLQPIRPHLHLLAACVLSLFMARVTSLALHWPVNITVGGGADSEGNVCDALVWATMGKIGSLQPDATKQGARVWIVSVIYLFAPLLF